MPRLAGRVRDDQGVAVSGATVNAYTRGTTTPVVAFDTTDSSGDWNIGPGESGGAALTTAEDLDAYTIEIVNGTDKIFWNDGDEVQTKSIFVHNEDAGEYGLEVHSAEDADSVEVAAFRGNRDLNGTPAANDEAFNSYFLMDSAGNSEETIRLTWTLIDETSTTEDGALEIDVVVAGSLTSTMQLTGTALSPMVNDAIALGTTALGWADVHLGSGAVINWVNGEMTITETDANTLTFAGGNVSFDDNNITNVGSISLDSVAADGSSISISDDVFGVNSKDFVWGHTAQIAGTITTGFQVVGNAGEEEGSLTLATFWTTDAGASMLQFIKSGSNTLGAITAVVDNELLGQMRFNGADVTTTGDFATTAAAIQVKVDDAGGVGASQIGGEILFMTALGSSNDDVASALRIAANKDIGMVATAKLFFDGTNTGGNTYIFEESDDDLHIVVGGTAMIEMDQDSAVVKILNADLDLGARLRFIKESKTIASGAIAVTSSHHTLVVEGGAGAGADILATATGGTEGDILVLRTTTTGANDQVTVSDGTGANTFILAGADFVMDNVDDRLMLMYNGVEWVELSRSDNS